VYNIDSVLLMTAMQHYKELGYKPLSSPMLVDREIVEITLPEGNTAQEHLGKFYVGSAEQSFYQLMKEGFSPNGSYMLVTPCERDDVIDDTHLNIFLKVELVSSELNYKEIMQDVIDLYSYNGFNVTIVETSVGCDLELNGVEVGSYGERDYLGVNISFGTGIALPRISQAISRDSCCN